MDILSHGLYGGAAFGRKNRKDYWIAFLFGIGPDLLAFGPHFVLMFLGLIPRLSFSGSSYPVVPDYIHSIYNVTHSLVVYAVFFLLLWLLGKKKFAKLTFAWPLHILVDIPVHSLAFFPTPFLWPISNFHINGIPWAEPIIFIPNIIVLLVIYIYWYVKDRKLTRTVN